jgi:hypothetical protein
MLKVFTEARCTCFHTDMWVCVLYVDDLFHHKKMKPSAQVHLLSNWVGVYYFLVAHFFTTQYNSYTHNVCTLITMNTSTQILRLWASSKTEPANSRDWRSHHRHLAVDGNIVYHQKHNTVKSYKIRSHVKLNLESKLLLPLGYKFFRF